MLTRRKALNNLCFVLIYLWFINQLFRILCCHLKNKNEAIVNSFCFDSSLLSKFSFASGLIMKPDILPQKWKTYNEKSPNDSNERIFFHETKGGNGLTIIQCCAVESAAKHHPNRSVQLFLRPPKHCAANSSGFSPFSSFQNPVWLEVLSQYSTVSVILLNEEKYFSQTPLEDWYNRGQWRQSVFETAHLSDYIRILTLYKGGGLYLDMDILTLKPYNENMFRNFLVYGSARMDHLSNGVMHMNYGHWLPNELIRLLAKEYDPESYIYHGPDAVTEIIKRECGIVRGVWNSNQCSDVQLLSDNLFYPVPPIILNTLFDDNANQTDVNMITLIKKSFGLHLWNSLSRMLPLDIYSNQILAILARENCPLTVAREKDFKSL